MKIYQLSFVDLVSKIYEENGKDEENAGLLPDEIAMEWLIKEKVNNAISTFPTNSSCIDLEVGKYSSF